MSNLFHKNSATTQAPALASNPVLSNATQMNNQFLHQNKAQVFNQQGSFVQQPIFAQAPAPAAGKQSRGHHHGLRKKRAQAVLPVQPIGGGPSIATIAPTPIVAAPLVAPLAAPLVAPVATRSVPYVAPLTAPIHETIVRPTIVQETIRTDRVVEVQPVVHRQIEQPVVNHIEKHITEAPAANLGGVVRLAPLVQQNTSTRVIDEVTPVIHREVAIARVERVEEHLSEHVVAPTQHTNSVRYESAPILAPIPAPIVAPVAPLAPITAPIPAPIVAPIVAPLATINAEPIHQTLTKAPIVEEVVRTDRVIEIQPVVHREVEHNVVNHIEKHITEAPAPLMGGTVRMAPIVTETLNTRVVDEIQPVVHRELAVAQVERVEEHLTEHFVAPTQHTNTVITETAAPILMEKKLDNGLLLKKNTYGSAMM